MEGVLDDDDGAEGAVDPAAMPISFDVAPIVPIGYADWPNGATATDWHLAVTHNLFRGGSTMHPADRVNHTLRIATGFVLAACVSITSSEAHAQSGPVIWS